MARPLRLTSPPCLCRSFTALAIVLGLAGCGASGGKDALFGVITPYKITIVQGNVVTREQAAMVKPGMTRSQVRDILGTPMLMDIFHADRWDYVFTIRRGSDEPQQRLVVAHFKGDSLDRLEAAGLPSEREFVAELRPGQGGGTPPALELTEEQRRALPAPMRGESRSTPPTGAIRVYPPLEPS